MTESPNRPRVDMVEGLLDPVHCDEILREGAQEILNQRERAKAWIKSSEGWKIQLQKCEVALAAKSREVDKLRALVDVLRKKANDEECT